LVAAQALLVEDGLDAVTHARVAERSGLGRRSLYRHWPDRRSLLRDTLGMTSAPHADPATDLRSSLVAHLEALQGALVQGPLAYIVAVLFERASHDPEFETLRRELVAAGCAPLERLLAEARADGRLSRTMDVGEAVACLEGPVFHAAMLGGRGLGSDAIGRLIDRFLDEQDYSVPVRRLGAPDEHLDRALAVAAGLEDEVIVDEFEQRR
jgi:AcrR family transcriptional regulator